MSGSTEAGRAETVAKPERCNCGASCGENRYHNYGDAECFESRRAQTPRRMRVHTYTGREMG